MREPLTAEHIHVFDVWHSGYGPFCAICDARKDAARDRPGLDVERLCGWMSAAYTYEDDDNSVPTLPFVDDFRAFWHPFAEKVAAQQREGAGE